MNDTLSTTETTPIIPSPIIGIPIQIIDKPKEPKKPKMKKWPDNGSLVSYDRLIKPLKSILDRGYRLFRKDVKSFDYDGYNIGKEERNIYASPKTRFESKSLADAQKKGTNLIDIVLNVAFLLGIEQGRRIQKAEQEQTNNLLNTLESYRERNKNLRLKNDELEAMLLLKNQYPTMKQEELLFLAQEMILQKRDDRIEQARVELSFDPSHSSFNLQQRKRAKFGELVDLARTLNKNICSLEDWLDILKDHGWTSKDWLDKCQKKQIKTEYN
jgi:hypothetical protein